MTEAQQDAAIQTLQIQQANDTQQFQLLFSAVQSTIAATLQQLGVLQSQITALTGRVSALEQKAQHSPQSSQVNFWMTESYASLRDA